MGEVLYYVDKFTDETLPCIPALEAWAAFLAATPEAPAPEDDAEGRPFVFQPGGVSTWFGEAPEDGAELKVSRLEVLCDIEVTRTADGWSHGPVPEGVTFVAVRFGPGLAWDAERSGDSLQHLLECESDFAEYWWEEGDTELIALARDLPTQVYCFTRSPEPRLTLVGDVQ